MYLLHPRNQCGIIVANYNCKLAIITPYLFGFFSSSPFFIKVRESDPGDIHRNKVVQLLDDFRITGINGNRKCCS